MCTDAFQLAFSSPFFFLCPCKDSGAPFLHLAQRRAVQVEQVPQGTGFFFVTEPLIRPIWLVLSVPTRPLYDLFSPTAVRFFSKLLIVRSCFFFRPRFEISSIQRDETFFYTRVKRPFFSFFFNPHEHDAPGLELRNRRAQEAPHFFHTHEILGPPFNFVTN